MINKLVSSMRKADGNITFLHNIIHIGSHKEYTVTECVAQKRDKEVFVDYTVVPSYSINPYLPKISFDSKNKCFTICAPAHDGLSIEDFQKFIIAQQKGLSAAKMLNALIKKDDVT